MSRGKRRCAICGDTPKGQFYPGVFGGIDHKCYVSINYYSAKTPRELSRSVARNELQAARLSVVRGGVVSFSNKKSKRRIA